MTLSADYVIVGSGAGGGPLAVRLAKEGHSVLVLEAGGRAAGPVYQVPIFHGWASESPDMSWNFYVRHYDDDARAAADDKYDDVRGGVLYPRAATVGGCTAHNAMITVRPNDSDWDRIADLTGDDSWRAAAMRPYFERMERCTYRRRWLSGLRHLGKWFAAFDVRGHGFEGWLPTSVANPLLLATDRQLLRSIATAAAKVLGGEEDKLRPWQKWSWRWFDPNTAAVQEKGSMLGIWQIPMAVNDGTRSGTREPLCDAEENHGLQIVTGLATKLIFDSQKRCTGVEFASGEHLYGADPHAAGAAPTERQTVTANREVILACGAFNTPQLLKLSGVGPADELGRHGIEVVVDAPKVGTNLHDRYEVGVVTQFPRRLKLLSGGTFCPPKPDDTSDKLFNRWNTRRRGPYATNGALLAVVAKSSPTVDPPDLFMFALPADFRGYRVGYAAELARSCKELTWTILKAYTNNRAGTVCLRSKDPFATPDIRFRYFDEGTDDGGADLDAVVQGVKLARGLTARLNKAWWLRLTNLWFSSGATEVYPKPSVATDDEIRTFVKNEAWGHHACGTAAIGPDSDKEAVLDSRFRVRGVTGLRVVDASIFPNIPGYFIVTAVYMASEKAADVILADLERAQAPELADSTPSSP